MSVCPRKKKGENMKLYKSKKITNYFTTLMQRKKNVGVIDTGIMTKTISVRKSRGKVLKRKMKHTELY